MTPLERERLQAEIPAMQAEIAYWRGRVMETRINPHQELVGYAVGARRKVGAWSRDRWQAEREQPHATA